MILRAFILKQFLGRKHVLERVNVHEFIFCDNNGALGPIAEHARISLENADTGDQIRGWCGLQSDLPQHFGHVVNRYLVVVELNVELITKGHEALELLLSNDAAEREEVILRELLSQFHHLL